MYQSAFWLTFGTIFVPTAFVYYLETHDPLISSAIFIVGMVSILVGNLEIKREYKDNLDIINAQFKNQQIIEHNAIIRHQELIKEIKKLRGETDDKPTDHFQSVL